MESDLCWMHDGKTSSVGQDPYIDVMGLPQAGPLKRNHFGVHVLWLIFSTL